MTQMFMGAVGLRTAYDARMICEEESPPRSQYIPRDDPENEIDPIDIHPFSKRREGRQAAKQVRPAKPSEALSSFIGTVDFCVARLK